MALHILILKIGNQKKRNGDLLFTPVLMPTILSPTMPYTAMLNNNLAELFALRMHNAPLCLH